MKRILALAALIAVGALSYAVAAQQQPPAGRAGGGAGRGPQARVVEVEKLKDNFYVLRGTGGGGNTAVFIQANGVTLVDTKNPGWGQPLLDKVKELTPKPVTTIINTHTHGDHVSGNVDFPATVEVVVHENTAANMKRMIAPSGLAPATGPTIFEQNQGRGLPKRTYKDRMTLGSGADQVDLYYFGRAHTNGDTFVVFPALRIMHAGDAFAWKAIPLLDANNGGSGVAIPDTLMNVYNGTVKIVDTIVTGHNPQMTPNDLREYSEFNRDFLNAVREAKKAGQTAEEFAKTWTIPAKYVGYETPPQAARLRTNVQIVYDELK